MNRPRIPEIGRSLTVNVLWYDLVPVPEKQAFHEGEVIGWRDTQIIVRVKDYAVLRFWKRNGIEVGNRDHDRRGFKVDPQELVQSLKPVPGVDVQLAMDGET
jgi:hypothetical protein